MGVCMLSHFSCVWLLTTIWTAASHAPLSMGFSRQEYWSGLPFPYPGHLSNLGIEPGSPALQTDILPSEPLGKPYYVPADSNVYTFQFLLSGIIVSASFWETCLRTQNIRPLNNKKRQWSFLILKCCQRCWCLQEQKRKRYASIQMKNQGNSVLIFICFHFWVYM